MSNLRFVSRDGKMILRERWRKIPGTNSAYEVSNLGRMRSWAMTGTTKRRLLTPAILKLSIGKDSRPRVNVKNDRGVRRCRLVHQLVLEAFVGPRPAGQVGCHLNGNAADNRLANLIWGTMKENSAHSLAHGTMATGTRNGQSKLNDALAGEIKFGVYASLGAYQAAQRFGLCHGTIRSLRMGITWKHVTLAHYKKHTVKK